MEYICRLRLRCFGKMFVASLFAVVYLCGNAAGSSAAASAAERMESWEHHVKLKNESIFKDLQWKALGPKFQGGRIESISCPAGHSSTIYVGVGAGNLWKSINNGITWEPIFENESTFAIGVVSVDPSDSNIVWVGTGEVLMARSAFAGTGVFKSVDAGKSWENVGLRDSHHVARVLIDPEDSDTVYVAALGHSYTYNEERGVFKTTDGGKSWEKVLYISEKVGVVEVVMDPEDNETLYAVAWERDRKAWNNLVSGEGSGIYKTTDAGKSWERLSGGLPRGEHVGRMAIAIAASKPNIVYVLVDNRQKRPDGRRFVMGEVYRSEDKGQTWQKMNEDYLPATIGYDFNLVRISPDNENEIYITGNVLLRSQDAGKTYSRVKGQLVHLLPHPAKSLHVDNHAMWIDPLDGDRILLGTDGGLYVSYDRCETWLHLNNIPVAEFYAITLDMESPYGIWGGTQDNGTTYGHSSDVLTEGVENWKLICGGDNYFTYLDPTDKDTVYYEYQFGGLRRKNLKDGKTRSAAPKSAKGEPPLRRNWMTPYIISHHNPYTLYFGAQRLFKSVNRAETWTCISGDLTTNPGPEKQGDVPYGTLTTISESPLKVGLLYVGTDDGNVQVTRDDGFTWKKLSDSLPAKWVSRVAASKYEPGRVYVALTGYREDDFEKYLYASSDFGETWQSIAANLPCESINVIREDPVDENILYVGTDLGIYASLDRGERWHSLCNGLPTAAVHDIAIHPREHEMVIGTHGRSAFVLDVTKIREFNKDKK